MTTPTTISTAAATPSAAADMPKAYDPQTVENRLYDWWEAQGYFKPIADNGKKPFVISMPPPNVTGELHLGHAITATMEDLMIRWHRMLGEPTLWVPGSDHASIAVHYVIDKALASRAPFMDELLRSIDFPLPTARQKMTRDDLGRDWFMKLAWAWRARYGSFITEQHRRLGASCDWQREAFTLDEQRSRAVRAAFVRLYEKGWIYKGKRLINWCPGCRSSVSDLEVEHEDTRGHLWTVRYHLEGAADEYISVATTRPETILGDTAVAVNPNDKRYTKLVGRTAILPVLGRRIPIIADEAVDPAFGTGAVKVTPGHDPTDYEIGLRHNLAPINVLNLDGTMNENAGPYAGLDRFACRKKLVQQLHDDGLLIKVEDYSHAVGHCQRSHDIIEPIISEQWFARQTLLAEAALKAVQDGRITFVPERFTKVYYHWMENIRDWNISRQLWWGHRIPAWYCDDCGKMTVTTEDKLDTCPGCASRNIRQDEDVLDTWFSSALWPFSTLGWPEQTEDLKRFYPTSVLETGYDIIFFWVARMIMMGLECTGDIPFSTVYLHGMIRDEKGEKMSKTKGNVVNPLEVIDKYGTDALRFTLATGSTPGNDMKLSLTRVEASRNFANKLWNAARFIKQQALATDGSPSGVDRSPSRVAALTAQSTLADRWVLSRYNRLCQSVSQLMESYQFGEAGRQIEDFLWSEFCDWYIEMSKIRLYADATHVRAPLAAPDASVGAPLAAPGASVGAPLAAPGTSVGAPLAAPDASAGAPLAAPDASVGAPLAAPDASAGAPLAAPDASAGAPLAAPGAQQAGPLPVLLHVLEGTLRLLHPFMPFVTEEIWQQLRGQWSDKPYTALIIAPYPQADTARFDDAAEEQMALVMDIVRSIRNARAEFGVDPARLIEAIIAAGRHSALINDEIETIATLARLDRSRLTLHETLAEKPQRALALVCGSVEVYLPLAGMVDLAAEQARLGKEIANVRSQIDNTETLLGNAGFTAKAPAAIIERERQKLAANQERLGKLEERLKAVRE